MTLSVLIVVKNVGADVTNLQMIHNVWIVQKDIFYEIELVIIFVLIKDYKKIKQLINVIVSHNILLVLLLKLLILISLLKA